MCVLSGRSRLSAMYAGNVLIADEPTLMAQLKHYVQRRDMTTDIPRTTKKDSFFMMIQSALEDSSSHGTALTAESFDALRKLTLRYAMTGELQLLPYQTDALSLIETEFVALFGWTLTACLLRLMSKWW